MKIQEEIGQGSALLWQHPNYDVEIDPRYLRGVEQYRCDHHTAKYKTLRCLSQISRQFTFELSECL